MIRRAAFLLLAAAAGAARAQTMLDQEQRLIDIHALLLDTPPVEAPGALAPWQLGLGLEIVGIPPIDGTTGSKVQITASDKTRAFPRPRVALGLPAPEGWRTFVALSYAPPVTFRELTANVLGAEGGVAWVPGAFRAGLRAYVVGGETRSPVTDPATRDTLRALDFGWDASAGYGLGLGRLGTLTPYAGAGMTWTRGRFRVESDGNVLTSDYVGLAVVAGARLLVKDHWEAVTEWAIYPGRLVEPRFRIAYVFDLGRR